MKLLLHLYEGEMKHNKFEKDTPTQIKSIKLNSLRNRLLSVIKLLRKIQKKRKN